MRTTMNFNSDEATAGCLTGLLRLLLCKNAHHPSLPSSTATESSTTHHHRLSEDDAPRKPPPSPNLVARLMGLDSMPVHPYTTDANFVRSRSANSIEGWNGFLSGQSNWASKTRPSQSFREEPTFLRKENDEFLVLSFGVVNPMLDLGEAARRTIQGKENADMGKARSRVVDSKDGKPPRHRHAKKHRKKKTESECSSQDSSPVSVLDQHFDAERKKLTDPDSPISEGSKRPKGERPRKKLSAGLEIDSYPSPAKTHETEGRSHCGGKRTEREEQCLSDAWGQICQLAAEDVMNSCCGFGGIWRVGDHIEEIASVLWLEILDLTIDELLAEFCACNIITN